ncbi:stAR-related lipid transfer protein 13 [Linepithema humile]|uniref:stAR-related lipid transfer protein 13 n=1 Tax=Linepithema humile TaxID=83485 RepID=UPI000623248C|nr:PREDICTED: rho GTPase-activating protein 7 [Linepithema humile]XP_012215215.1 PREDICTED: rho GTPase-activating protein 7 [Linepithema humile]
METMQEGGGRLQNGSIITKTPNRLKFMESNESDKVTNERTAEMDPYKELELYLAKVNEEIGEIIESAPATPICITEEPKYRTLPEKLSSHTIESLAPKSLSATKSHGSVKKRRNSLTRGSEDIGNWSEFNNIIANEINELTKERARREATRSNDDVKVVQYKELLNEFGISDSENSDSQGFSGEHDSLRDEESLRDRRNGKLFVDDDCRYLLNSDYDEPHDRVVSEERKSGSLPENLQDIIGKRGRFHTSDTLSSDYDEPSNCLPMNSIRNQIDRITSSLPSKLERECATKDARLNPCRAPKTPVELSTKTNEDTSVVDGAPRTEAFRSVEDAEEPNAKLPPRQRSERKISLPISLTIQKRRKATRLQRLRQNSDDQETMDPDYDDVFPNDETGRSRSLDNHVPKSAPVTPTEEKKPPFSKLLRKRHAPVYHESTDDVILVSVSSLPDQDLLRLRNDRLHETRNSKMKEALTKKRAISPLTLRSDITAKRLSESDKDIRRISPVDLKKFSLIRPWGNDVAVNCDLPKNDDINGNCGIENGTLSKLDHADMKRIMEEQNARAGSLPISLQSLLSRIRNGSGSCCPNSPPMDSLTCSDIATQTSPAISRSSSFTWVSDCESPQAESQLDSQSLQDESTLDPVSPQDTVDDDNRSSSSSQDLLQSMDEISSGSLSPDTTDRASPLESGIGTASPPRSTDRRLVKPLTPNKCHRKETWERIRRRPSKLNSRNDKNSQDVWVKRESVHTQTKLNDDQYSQDAVDSSSGLDDSLPRIKALRPTNLPLCLSTTASSSLSSGELLETPPRAPSSPSAASLQLKPEPLTVEMGGKSSSAPLLENNDTVNANGKVPSLQQQPRSQSERQLSEIEAQEACKWLRAAGFPQYAQMYEDYQFPIDVSGVAKDHPFLEADSLQSLFRRLHALNRCANMKLDTHHTHHSTSHSKSGGGGGGGGDESDEDTQCALSENWTFEKKTRRWSRIVDVSQANVERLQAIAGQNAASEEESVDDRLEAEEADDTMLENLRYGSLPPGTVPDENNPRFRRSGSERLRDGAKAFLRRVESLKSRRRKRQNRDGVVISGPQVLDVMSMQQKMKELNCVDVSPTGPAPVSFNDLLTVSQLQVPGSPVTLPATPYHLPPSPLANAPSPFGDDSSSYCSDGSQGGGPTPTPTRTKMNRARRFLHRGREDQGALSDSECQPTNWRHRYFRDANSNHAKVLEYVNAHPQSPKDSPKNPPISTRGGSLNLGKESQRYRDKLAQGKEEKTGGSMKREDKMHKSFRHRDDSYRDGKPLSKEVTVYRDKSRSRSSELAGSQESGSTVASRDSDQEEESPRHKGTVVRWHSFQRGSLYPEPLDPLCPRAMASMSCGQLLVLRKLALLKLTACMERYCPTHRTGWNWELPKFIRKIKTPDYKDKTVFGVPLLLSLQRTGQALPKCIQIALRWLRANALDQVGIFRKSGVKSRIQKLKVMTETQGDNINFDGQQAYDVADLVKQYFRELPEALLTNKLSETFIAIFQHVPVELRPDAVQCVLLLLPDEHREALETLLDFLNHVASNSPYNQMTASNLAVCLAPSLFHFNHSNTNVTNRSSSVSPRRRKTVGIPDQRELSENKAAHDCLLYLVKMHRELFMVSSDMLTQCHFNYMEESIPVALEELGSELKQDWRGYLYACTTALLKEAREKSRGWVTVNNPADNSVEMAYKKVGDGHPLRLCRVSTEVEAPPNELLHRVLRERHIWDPQLLKYRLVNKLDTNVEVFQYATGNMSPLPARDYCVLRSWRNDLPKGACVIVETSVQHPDAPVMLGGTRGIVLASRYLIEPCGSGKSRIMHLSRVDTKGRTPEWYNKSYGHITALHLSKIRNSFKHTTDGPESKV